MALRNGILVHSFDHWAAAVRARRRRASSSRRAASPSCPRADRAAAARARRRADGRGRATCCPSIRRRLPEARLPIEAPGMGAALAGVGACSHRSIRRTRLHPRGGRGWSPRRCAAAGDAWRCAGRASPATTAPSTRRSAATSTDGDAGRRRQGARALRLAHGRAADRRLGRREPARLAAPGLAPRPGPAGRERRGDGRGDRGLRVDDAPPRPSAGEGDAAARATSCSGSRPPASRAPRSSRWPRPRCTRCCGSRTPRRPPSRSWTAQLIRSPVCSGSGS